MLPPSRSGARTVEGRTKTSPFPHVSFSTAIFGSGGRNRIGDLSLERYTAGKPPTSRASVLSDSAARRCPASPPWPVSGSRRGSPNRTRGAGSSLIRSRAGAPRGPRRTPSARRWRCAISSSTCLRVANSCARSARSGGSSRLTTVGSGSGGGRGLGAAGGGLGSISTSKPSRSSRSSSRSASRWVGVRPDAGFRVGAGEARLPRRRCCSPCFMARPNSVEAR